MSRRSRLTHDFNEVLLETRAEAAEVLERLGDLIDKYGNATVADLYDLAGISGDFTDEKYGWTDLRRADIARTRNGRYVLDLPRPEPID